MLSSLSALIMVLSAFCGMAAGMIAPIIFVLGIVLLFFSGRWGVRVMIGAVAIVVLPFALAFSVAGLRALPDNPVLIPIALGVGFAWLTYSRKHRFSTRVRAAFTILLPLVTAVLGAGVKSIYFDSTAAMSAAPSIRLEKNRPLQKETSHHIQISRGRERE